MLVHCSSFDANRLCVCVCVYVCVLFVHWQGEKNAGFDVLYHNMKHGQLATKELAEFVRERAAIEETYSKSMSKLAKIASNGSPQGTFAPMWDVFRVSSDKLALCHLELMRKLNDLIRDINKYGEEQIKIHRKTKEEMVVTVEAVQVLQVQSGHLQKSKEGYHAKCLELDRLKKEGAPQKEVEKAELKSKKAAESFALCIEKYNRVGGEFEQKMSESAQKFQEIEEAHLRHMKQLIKGYSHSIEDTHVQVGQVHEEFKQNVENIGVDNLIQKFAEQKGTGKDRPALVGFEEYMTALAPEGGKKSRNKIILLDPPLSLRCSEKENNFYSSDSDFDDEEPKKFHIQIRPVASTNRSNSAATEKELKATVGALTLPPNRGVRQQVGITLVWTHLPISPLDPPLSRWVGQHGLLCHRVKNKHWHDLQTLSSLLSMTPHLVAALTRRITLPVSGPTHVPPVSPQTWTIHRCDSLLSLSPSPHMKWSRRCGTVNTSLLRTPFSLRLKGPSLRRVSTCLMHGPAHLLAMITLLPTVHLSRGPSPISLSTQEAWPVAAAITEYINAYFKGGQHNRCLVKITGDLTMSFPAGINRIFTANPNVPVLSFRLVNISRIDHFLPNQKLLYSDPSQSDPDTRDFWFNMQALQLHLQREAELNPQASYYNVGLLKYQVSVNISLFFLFCQRSGTVTRVSLDYHCCPATAPSTQLTAVQVLLPLDHTATDLQCQPPASWNAEERRLLWKLPNLSPTNHSKGSGTLCVSWQCLEVPRGPPPSLAVQFVGSGASLSGMDVELVGSRYRMSLIKKRFATGKYMAGCSL
uniref:FCH and mu domain containing endocytic adaptor 1 n=1 Tax=Mastacembelus armatus TaxID=205130 RepID=A0A3Q3RW42_9TELE